MRKPSLRALFSFLLLTPLLTIAATPDIQDGPANLRDAADGAILATLETGTPVTVLNAGCQDGVPWLHVRTDSLDGWVSAALVNFGDGVPAVGPSDAQLELRSLPFGDVTAMLQPGQALTANGVTCVQDTAWLSVVANGQSGWVLADFVTLQAVPATPTPSASASPTAGDSGSDSQTPEGSPTPTASPEPTVASPTRTAIPVVQPIVVGATPTTSGQQSGTPVTGVGQQPAAGAPYVSASPEYGMGVFVWGRPDAPQILGRVKDMRFQWQKSLIRWRDVEGTGKGQFDWSGTDALLQSSNAAGLKTLARLDFEPAWARRDGANNGPPDNYKDYADFVGALVNRYKAGSPNGRLEAIEVWNEVNLSREWGEQPINQQQAADYVRLLCSAYKAAKAADPNVMVVTAGLSPTGWNDDTARPDDVYLQWLYDAGMKGCYDALGAHGPGFKAPPEVSPEEAAENPNWGGHRSFTFRRIEDLRDVMVRNGDSAKQIWVLEFGWTSDTVHPAYGWHRVSEEEKGEYLVRAFKWAKDHWGPWIGPMMVWNMPDPAWGPQDEMYWWGITNPDGSPRPAFTALQQARQNGTLP